ncbi:MAG: tetratricopeptide repeat protein [Anaerolineae bacterium]|nr:tetratricopeptide repeat protein [Anaerolineae bacterium]
MIWLIARLRRDVSAWDRPTQAGFVLALGLLAIAVLLFFIAPQEQRQTILIGIGALIIVTQILVMWGNRTMVAPLTQAQRAFLRGDLEGAVALLEPMRASGEADARTLTLLGNAYRQLGRLDESAAILSEAVDNSPNHHYPLYGFGRTLIVQGNYADGVAFVKRALEAGAPPAVRFDIAEAYYRQGNIEDLVAVLSDVDVAGEEPRELLLSLWRWRYAGAPSPRRELLEGGIVFWEVQAERFAATPYGASVGNDVTYLKSLLNAWGNDGDEP